MDAESITETVVKPLDLSMGIYDYDAERLVQKGSFRWLVNIAKAIETCSQSHQRTQA